MIEENSLNHMNRFGVYQIEINKKRYIGSTSQTFMKRYCTHLWQLRKGRHHSRYLQNAFNKYGEQALMFSILEIIEVKEEAIITEQMYIDKINPEYNSCKIAGSCLGVKFSEEAKLKLSKLMTGNRYALGYRHTEEAKNKISEANKGKTISEETKQKMSARIRTEAEKLNISELNRHRKYTEETRQKLRNAALKRSEEIRHNFEVANRGRKISEETREKLRTARLGRKQTEETKMKIGKGNCGKKRSEETKQRGREAAINLWETKRANDQLSGNSKLIEEDIRQIRYNLKNLSRKEIAGKFNISIHYVSVIRRNKKFEHVKEDAVCQ
jgi:group I intron endonuclease